MMVRLYGLWLAMMVSVLGYASSDYYLSQGQLVVEGRTLQSVFLKQGRLWVRNGGGLTPLYLVDGKITAPNESVFDELGYLYDFFKRKFQWTHPISNTFLEQYYAAQSQERNRRPFNSNGSLGLRPSHDSSNGGDSTRSPRHSAPRRRISDFPVSFVEGESCLATFEYPDENTCRAMLRAGCVGPKPYTFARGSRLGPFSLEGRTVQISGSPNSIQAIIDGVYQKVSTPNGAEAVYEIEFSCTGEEQKSLKPVISHKAFKRQVELIGPFIRRTAADYFRDANVSCGAAGRGLKGLGFALSMPRQGHSRDKAGTPMALIYVDGYIMRNMTGCDFESVSQPVVYTCGDNKRGLRLSGPQLNSMEYIENGRVVSRFACSLKRLPSN